MRVAIVNLTAGGLSGGYLKYLRNLVPRLASHPDVAAVAQFLPEPARGQLSPEGGPVFTWSLPDARRGFSELRRAVAAQRPDVVFIPTAAWLRFGNVPVVIMVRNMEPLERPFGGNPLREALRNLGRRTAAKRACRRAARIIAVSEHVQQFLKNRWRLPPDKVQVIHHGVDEPSPDATATAPASLSHFDAGPFLFTAGSIRPARGLRDLIDALTHLSEPRPLLVIAGEADAATASHQRALQARAKRLGVDDRIVWTGRLTETEMKWCYRHCHAFVMTSRAEACPNIALEAMSFGCATVSTDHPPMPEFFGDAAWYYKQENPRALAEALRDVAMPPRRTSLAAAARARIRAFDWNVTAEKTIAELRRAVRS